MGLFGNLDFSKATEQRKNTPDGEYEVELGRTYSTLVKGGGGVYAFTEYKILSGPLQGTEAAWRQQALNDSTPKALAGCAAAAMGYELSIPEHKVAFDTAYPEAALKAKIDQLWDVAPPGNPEFVGKRVKLTIRTKKTRNQRDFREHTFSPIFR